jgi:hypothetical protein
VASTQLATSQMTRHKKVRPRSDAATDGDRLGRVIVDGGLIKRIRRLALLYNAAMTVALMHRPCG